MVNRMIYIKKHFGFILVVIFGLVPLLSLLTPGLPLTHDGQDHVARIANFYTSLQEGNLIPRWAGNLNWGYGHPVMMFLYPLSSYIASLFHFVGFSFIDSVKLVFAFGYIASGIAMYLWARDQFDEYVGIASAVLYMYAPYRFVDMYVRGAIGEHTAFIFPPLILLFIHKFFRSNKPLQSYLSFLGIAVSTSLLILSHNAISIMFMPVIAGYIVFLSYSNKNFLKLLIAFVGLFFGFGLSSFYLVPAFMEGKYTLRDIVTGDEYKTRFVDPIRLIYSKWSYGITGQFSVGLGYIQLLGLVITPFVLVKFYKEKVKTHFIFYLVLIIIFVISIFLMLNYSQPIYDIVTTLKKFQFPWRFLSLSIFATSIITSMFLLTIKKEKYKKIVFALGLGFIFLLSFEQFAIKGTLTKSDKFFESIYDGTTDTGESSPLWSIRFMEKRPTVYTSTIDGDAYIQPINRNSTQRKYLITVKSDKARVVENIVYFPGWKVYDNGKVVDVEYQDPAHRGLITYYLKSGTHAVLIAFENTKIRNLAELITLSSFIILVIGILVVKFKK